MNSAQKRVLTFFDVEIRQFVLGDLEILSHIRPHPTSHLGGCAVPQSMLIFSTLDLLGYLINRSPNARKTETAKNLKVVFYSELKLFPEEYKNYSDELIELFRHGVMHQFFSKASGIGKYGTLAASIMGSGGIPTLNIDKFTEDFTSAVSALREAIASGDYNDLAEQINSRLDTLAFDDMDDLQRLNKKKVDPSAPFNGKR